MIYVSIYEFGEYDEWQDVILYVGGTFTKAISVLNKKNVDRYFKENDPRCDFYQDSSNRYIQCWNRGKLVRVDDVKVNEDGEAYVSETREIKRV